MKKFTDFLNESASLQAARMGLYGDGHGNWYNRKTKEFIAKTKSGRLEFYNKCQKIGKKDPPQSERDKKYSGTTRCEENEKTLREKYLSKEIFVEGSYVKNIKTGDVGKIVRCGTNHLICVTEKNEMFKSWIEDVMEVTNVSGVPADQRLVGTDAHLKYVKTMVPGNTWGKQFINKYSKKVTIDNSSNEQSYF